MTPEEFRAAGYQIIDWIADYRANVGDYPVMSTIEPGQVRSQLPTAPPQSPEPFDAIMEDLDQILMPSITHWNHPDYFAYFPSNATLASVLGDLLSSGIGGIGLNWQSMPVLTEVEEVICDWMQQKFGLSPAWQSTIHDTASTATMVALLCARERATNHSRVQSGMQAEPSPLTV